MVERPTKVMHNDAMVDALDVPILESSEKWSEFTLEDGTVVRGKMSLVSAARIPGEFDAQGNPVYALNITGGIALAYVPPNLMKQAQN